MCDALLIWSTCVPHHLIDFLWNPNCYQLFRVTFVGIAEILPQWQNMYHERKSLWTKHNQAFIFYYKEEIKGETSTVICLNFVTWCSKDYLHHSIRKITWSWRWTPVRVGSIQRRGNGKDAVLYKYLTELGIQHRCSTEGSPELGFRLRRQRSLSMCSKLLEMFW